jgi:hypothetical protein
MTIRTFKQFGMAYATESLTIAASIDDSVVYEGTIPTVDQPGPGDPASLIYPFGESLFTWELDTAFSGTVTMTFTIAGPGRLYLTDTLANYVQIKNPNSSEPAYINGGSDVFGYFYQKTTPQYVLGDPFENVTINGILQTVAHSALLSGQTCWFVEAGGTFSATVNIVPSTLAPAVV